MKILEFVKKLFAKNKEEKPEDIICPVCGYYCLGKGGYGCIDKPTIVKMYGNDTR